METTNHITLSALCDRISRALSAATGGELWVVAEVSSVQTNYTGHCYLELTEREAGQQMPRAVCRAAIWANKFKIIASYFRTQTGQDITVGMKILVKCSVSFHAVYGLSLIINDIDPSYTIGEVERVRRQTIERLRREGVFEMNRELELPPVIQRIAIISSATAAGYGDFCKELERSHIRFETTLFQAIMQGEGAEKSIIEALGEIATAGDCHAVVIIRGGGSASDLSCFDSYELCSNIAQFPLPIIAGIGHERDRSVADEVACLSLKTPTAVATYIVERAAAFANRLEQAQNFMVNRLQLITAGEGRRIENLVMMLSSSLKNVVQINSSKLNSAAQSIELLSLSAIQNHHVRIASRSELLTNTAGRAILGRLSELDLLGGRLKNSTEQNILAKRQILDLLQSTVDGANPRRILARGYAIINGGIRSVKQINENDIINIELRDGIVEAKSQKIWQKKS